MPMPKKPPQPEQQWVTFRADLTIVQQLDKAAKDADRPRSWVIRKLLAAQLAQEAEPALEQRREKSA